MNKCDIIIPIYNAYECVISCIDSVLRNTKFNDNKLILINDKSTDSRIDGILEDYSKKYPQIIVYLSNEENLGFVGTVNKGMKYSKNDVILLNSDTEVTPRWLDKIAECAYSSDNIATVTPLSNNATLASVPIPFEVNELPKDYSIDQMADLVEKCSFNHYPEIPTGHGFCLFIKREAIDKVGYFDQETYGKGYGEENDFCFRCYEYGYRHVLCDNTYIFHKESQSFLDSKADLIADGLKKIEKKYPDYKYRLDMWVQNKPIDYIGANIALTIGNKSEKPNILFVIHDWNQNNLGGTTLHAWDLIKNMRKYFNFHVLTPEDGFYKVYSYFESSEMAIKYPGININMTWVNYYNSEYKRFFSKIIDNYKISFVHIHHMIGHFFDIGDVLKEKNIKYMVTLHDFYAICPLINKLYKEKEYCGKKPTESQCNECLNCVFKVNMDIKTWRHNWDLLLDGAEKVVVPSEATLNEIKCFYDKKNMMVIEHGVDIVKENSSLVLNEKNNDIAFLGAIGYHKGSAILEEFIKYNRVKNSRIHLFGIINSQYLSNSKHFINHGRYQREDLKELLTKNNIKLICLFSIWPETYSYTMSEAISCGIPVVAFDFGAIAERIKKYNLGWVIKPGVSNDEIANEIMNILKNKEEYKKVISCINKYRIKSTKEMANSYIKIYSKYAVLNGPISSEVLEELIRNRVLITYSSHDDYSWVFSTLKWRMISKIKIPKKIKAIYRKLKSKKSVTEK